MSNKNLSILISCAAMVLITIIGYFVNITFVDKDNNDDYDNYTTTVITTTTKVSKRIDTSPDDIDKLINDLVILNINPSSGDQYVDIVEREMAEIVIESIKEIDIKLLKGLWLSGSKIVITDQQLTDLPELAHIKGEEMCYGEENTCLSFDETYGLMTNNTAYLRLKGCYEVHYPLNSLLGARSFCNVENRTYFDTAILFHEIAHLIDYSRVIKRQFDAEYLLSMSTSAEFLDFHSTEYKELYKVGFSDENYFAQPWEHFAESFTMYYDRITSGIGGPSNKKILREKAPRTYEYIDNIVKNYEPGELIP